MMRASGKVHAILAITLFVTLSGCGGPPDDLGLDDGRLAACPDRPNCVSSDTGDLEPLRFTTDQAVAWSGLQDAVAELPRTTIVTADDAYLHAEAKSRIFGFVDDLEFHLRPEDKLIALRSAARTGYSDMGVNAKRLEELRTHLQTNGVLP